MTQPETSDDPTAGALQVKSAAIELLSLAKTLRDSAVQHAGQDQVD